MNLTPVRDNSSSIRVVARFRPENTIERQQGGSCIISFNGDDTCSLETRDFSGNFTFDRVFPMESRQNEIFEYSIRSTVDDILNGYNGTVFAYGQTGSGKTYTMMGPDINSPDRGIIPRIVQQIFDSIMQSPPEIEYTVRVSYMEIYMEKIKDLLNPVNDNLPIHEDKTRGVYVKGLNEIYVSSVQEVFDVMRQGANTRTVASTNMNQESSRSHSIFALAVSQKNTETGSSKAGQLFLVDLAGSEKVGKTGASGIVLEEAKKINKSLSALGMVINALTDGKSTHIPYRDSKLTRILQESLGGNSRTTLIVNCSPSSYNDQETLSTLRFGVRAKSIKNKPKVNAELSPAELKALLRKYMAQNTSYVQYIDTLEKELALWHAGEQVATENWTVPSTGLFTVIQSPLSARVPETPSTPKRSSTIDLISRSSTPKFQSLDPDERDEFLRRENDLQDRLTEKENIISGLELLVSGLREKRESAMPVEDNNNDEKLKNEVVDLRRNVERLEDESKESMTKMEDLQHLNNDLTAELDSVRKQLLEASLLVQQKTMLLDDRTRRKREKLEEITRGFSVFEINDEMSYRSGISSNSSVGRDGIDRCSIEEGSAKDRKGDPISSILEILENEKLIQESKINCLKSYLVEAKEFILRTEQVLDARLEEVETQIARREEIENHLHSLDDTVNSMSVESPQLEAKYEEYIKSKQIILESLLSDVQRDLNMTIGDNKRLREILANEAQPTAVLSETRPQFALSSSTSISSASLSSEVSDGSITTVSTAADSTIKTRSQSGKSSALPIPLSKVTKTLKQQAEEFEAVKKSLMRDLQNRCERIVELEIMLDDLKEQYRAMQKTASASKSQQKRMAFLERNLEQLTQVQRSLVEQNTELKREAVLNDCKINKQNERIAGLEMLLQDAQERLAVETLGFENRLNSLKERLDDVKAYRKQADGGKVPLKNSSAGASLQSQRIVKPLRGGGNSTASSFLTGLSNGGGALGGYLKSPGSENKSSY
ncbi:P-loop containing nucleoside triphosphate hydrolase protein [Dipodascopsis uninucleata]